MRSRLLGIVVVTLAVVLGACRGGRTAAPADAAAEAARLERHLRRHPDDDDAWRRLAHIRWLHLEQTDAAVRILDRLAADGDVVALASRLIMAEARRDADTVERHAHTLISRVAAIDPKDPRRASLTALAELAARAVRRQHGDRPGDDERFIRFYDGLDLTKLPFEAWQPLVSLRAGIARRHGQDYRGYYDRQGCVRAFAVGRLAGTLGELELSRLDEHPYEDDPEASLVQLACVVRVWNPTPRAGIRRLRTRLRVDDDVLVLNLGAQEAVRVYLDGVPIHATDVFDRWLPKRVVLELPVTPGEHELEIATAIPRSKAWLLVRATDGHGRPVASSRPTGTAPATFAGDVRRRSGFWADPSRRTRDVLDDGFERPLAAYLAVEDALADGDTDLAERIAARIDADAPFAEGHLMVARFERDDPSRSRTTSSVRERKALERALALASDLDAARLQLLSLQLERGEEDDVVEVLEALPTGRLRDVEGELLRWRAHLADGSEHLADGALARATELHPRGCQVLLARRSRARDRDDVGEEDRLTSRLKRCAGTLKLRARLARRRGALDEARALARSAVRRVPDDVDGLELLADLAVLEGRDDDAIRHWDRILALNPYRVSAHLQAADVLARAGKTTEARARIRAALDRLPHNTELRLTAESLGVQDDLWRWRIDGTAVRDAFVASRKEYEGVSEALVLDYSAARVYRNGGQRQIVHQIVALLGKDALDRYGEFQAPEGAHLLTLHSIKPDGRLLEPESIPGKDGLSLRDLEIGDLVEFEFVVDRDPNPMLPGYLDVSTFRFQSPTTPFHRSELVVVAPSEVGLREERRNGPPPRQDTRDGELQVWRWRADEVPRFGVEPGHRALLDELPAVRIHSALDVEAYLEGLALTLRTGQRSNPELRSRVRRLLRKHETDRDRLRALWRWVLDEIEDSGDLTTQATATLDARRGNRLMLLLAMLRVAEIPAELWLARDRHGPSRRPNGHPMVETFSSPLLAVRVAGEPEPLMVMTASEVVPLGYLPPAHAGGEALRVRLHPGDGRPGAVRVPERAPRHADLRRYELAIELDAEGDGVASGSLALQGMEAVAWRQTLRDVDRDRIEEVFQQAELGRLFRGATLEELTVDDEHRLEHPLTLRFRASVRGLGVRQGGALVLPAALVPLNFGVGYTELSTRKTGVVVPYAPIQEARVVVDLVGAKFIEVPSEERIDGAYGSFHREIEDGGVGRSKLVLKLRSTFATGIVEATAYPELARFTQQVDAAEDDVIRAR